MATTIDRRIVRVYANGLTKIAFDPDTNKATSSIGYTKRDDVELQFAITDTNSINPLDSNYYPLSGTEMVLTGCSFKFGVKTNANYVSEGAYSLYSETLDSSSTWYNLALGRVSVVIASNSLAAGSYKAELEATTALGRIISLALFDLTITQDLNVGTEGTPPPTTPTYVTLTQFQSALQDRFVYVVDHPFALENNLVIDDGLYFDNPTSVSRLGCFLQVPAQGQDAIVALQKNDTTVGSLTIPQGEQYADIDFSPTLAFNSEDKFSFKITQVGTAPNPGQYLRMRMFHRRTQ